MNNSTKWFAVESFHILALVLVLVVSCGGESKSAATPQNSTYKGGRPTCVEFKLVVKDTRKGILTDAELLERLQFIEHQVSAAEPDILAASKALLDTATQGDVVALAEATEAMVDACSKYGYWEQS